jgi:type IV secretion system protein VirD4
VYLSIDNVKTSNLNILVVGPPGSGKSFRLARPMLSQLCGNFLVTDPKGELYKQTGQYFEDNGYEVMVMNVESEDGMPMSIHFNPFSYIRNESDIMSIAGILMKATTPQDDAGGSNDQFFEQSAEVLLTSLIYLIHYYYPEELRNWRTFVKLLDATTVYTKADGSIDNREGGIMSIERKAQLQWKKTHDTDFPGYVAVEKYYNGAAETTSSIVASLDAHCRYMKLQCVVDLLSEDEIHIAESFGYSKPSEESSTGKRILFIVTSEDKRYYDWIPSMVYSLFFDELYHLTAIDPNLHEALPQHLTFLMDEFANVTLPDSFVEKLSTMRSRNMSAVIIVQNLIQLKRKFPKFDMDKDLIGNCSIIDILGAPDMDSCEYLSKHFGTQTIHKASDSDAKDYKGQSSRSEDVMEKSLLSAEDIFAMKKDGECAIVIKGDGSFV